MGRVLLPILDELILQGAFDVNIADIGQSNEVAQNISNLFTNVHLLFFRKVGEAVLHFPLPLEYLCDFAYFAHQRHDQIAGSMVLVPITLFDELAQH